MRHLANRACGSGAVWNPRWLLVALVAAITSCNTPDASGPGDDGLFVGYDGRAALAGGNASVGPNNLGLIELPTYPYRTLVLLTISGLVHVEFPPVQNGSPRPGRDTDSRGVAWSSSCVEGLQLWTNNGYEPLSGYSGCPTSAGGAGSQEFSASYVYMGNTTKAKWAGPIPGGDGIYSGGFNVQATPVQGTAQLDASEHTIVRGRTIHFTATIIPASLGGLAMPSSVSWKYLTNGGQTIFPCGGYSCDYPPQASGRMVLTGTVNNVAFSRTERITVLDSLPPLPTDSTPPDTGSGPPGGGGGGGGGGGTLPPLSVVCTNASGNSTVLRGEEALCTISIASEAVPVTMLTALSSNSAQPFFSSLPLPDLETAQTPYVWRGVVAGSAVVKAEVNYHGRAIRASGNLTVVARTWAAPTLPPAVESATLGPASTRMLVYPGNKVFGGFVSSLVGSGRTRLISGGPNDGVWYFSDVPGIFGTAYIHPALDVTTAFGQALSWYNDQNGTPASTCGGSQIAQFRSEVRRHEGATGASNSHWGRLQQALPTATYPAALESLAQPSEQDLLAQMPVATLPWFTAFDQAERLWDHGTNNNGDVDAIINALGCTLDYNLADN